MAYKKTFLDRHGPDGARWIRLIGPMFLFTMFVTLALALAGVTPWIGFPIGLVTAVICAGLMYRFSEATGEGFLSFLQPSGSSTPYAKQYSYQESLAIRGDVAGAIASYEEVIAQDTSDVEARIRVAELYARKGGDPQRAAECLRAARRVEGLAPERDLYISNRLIDLLRGPMRDEGRALVELRRLVQLYPASRDAQFARDAIAKMKVDSVKDPRDVAH